MPRSTVISLNANLPPRARSLDDATTANIFGGCVGEGQRCNSTLDCCDAVDYIAGMGFFGLKCGGTPKQCYKDRM